MTLTEYRQKRDFTRSPEPLTKKTKKSPKLLFVVQRHQASHLHYDFRLEMGGVLKSWAVPKGPSMNPADKRLAVMVEDHPYGYKDFKGVIPPGNYGAGLVEIWDEGVYSDIEESGAEAEARLLHALAAGNLKFVLHGKRLKGEFALVKLKNSKQNAWLLIKHNDNYAVHEAYDCAAPVAASPPRLAPQAPKTRKKPFKNATPIKGNKLSDFIPAMLASEADHPFDDKDWLFEIKWDGYRAIAELQHNTVKLYSRNGNLFNNAYPQIVEALAELNLNAVVDGEIVVMDEAGRPNFQLLQHYGEDPSYPMQYYVFDLLKVADQSVMRLPLLERKARLRALFEDTGLIRYSGHVEAEGKQMFKLASQNKLEGIMAKAAQSVYLPGQRTANWLKIKHHHTVDAIICGFTEPSGERAYFGALVLGLKRGQSLTYIGHSGSGFTQASLKEVYNRLSPLITSTSPFKEKITTNAPVTWVKPMLVCEVKISGKTRDNKLRHPIFLRIRDDKTAEASAMDDTRTRSKPKTASEQSDQEASSAVATGRAKVQVSHRDKVFWPEENITKGDMVDYYLNIAQLILPYLKNRPQSLKRNPHGIHDKGFYHKDAGEHVPDFVQTLAVRSESTYKDIDYIICNNRATLTYLNNLGCIELNPWHSTVHALDTPDYLIIDIDPSEKNTFDQVVEVAMTVHDILENAGAPNFCKTSGATGLHVYVPTRKKYSYDQIKGFAELICLITQERLPATTTMERRLAHRGNKIYLDHLQNRRGQTIASAYSLRPYPGATVSTPLEWQEVKPGLTPADYHIFSLPGRIRQKGDLFKGVLGKGIDMEKCLKKLP